MTKKAELNHDALTQRVRKSLHKAEKIVADLRENNRRLLIAGIVSSAGSTLVAGITAAVGPTIGISDPGWRTACIIAAVFAFVSALSTGLNQQLNFSDRLSKGMRCIGRLRSLDVRITLGNSDWSEIADEYQEITKTFPEFVR